VRRFALALAVLALVPAAAAEAAKVPKALCLTWTNQGDANDTVTMDFVLRPAGSLKTQDIGTGDVKYKFYAFHGISGLGTIPGGTFPNLAGTGSTRNTSSSLLMSILYITNVGTYTFRASYDLEDTTPGGTMTRIAPNGTATTGDWVGIDCAGETIDD
jgi:hypothetical protein